MLAEQTRKMQLLLEEVAQLRVEISSAKVILQFGEGGLAGQNPLEKALLGVVGGVGLLTAATQPLPRGLAG